MELVKNIFFNTDKLIENTKVKISYNGKLFEEGSEEVYIHYGYGLQWDNLNDVKMQKTELGYQVEINLLESDQLNFCFRNSNNIWDNNNYANYVFPIEKSEKALVVTNVEDKEVKPYRRLRKSYLIRKKVKIAFLKVMSIIPKFIETCKRKAKADNF